MSILSACKFLFLFLFSSSVFAQNIMLVIDTGENPSRNERLRKQAAARGQKIVFYPGPGKKLKKAEVQNILATTKFDTLVLAGHSGSGDYSGDKGTLSKEDLVAGISKNEYAKKNCHELLTLGCNTANKSKAWFYQALFDDLQILYGFSGSAPYSYTQESIKYVNDFFKYSNKIRESKMEQELKSILKLMTSTENVNTGIYIHCPAGEFYYYDEKTNTMPSQLEQYDLMGGCDEKRKEFVQKYQQRLNEYMLGIKEPEVNTDEGFLRDAYTFVNRNEQCLHGSMAKFSVQRAMMLLFNKSFIANFLAYYKPLFEKALEEMNLINSKVEFVNEMTKVERERINILENCLQNLTGCELKRQKVLDLLKSIQDEYLNLATKRTFTEEEYARFEEVSRSIADYEVIKERDISAVKSSLVLDLNRTKFDLKIEKVEQGYPTFLKSKELLNKFINNPSEVTRKDFADLSQLEFSKSPIMNAALNVTSEIGVSLEGDIPFSWHEPPREKIEGPNYFYSLENVFPSKRKATKSAVDSPELREMMLLNGYSYD